MSLPLEAHRSPTPIASLTRDALDRAALRRALGTSLLAAWRVLGRLLARGERSDGLARHAVDDALRKVDDVRSALCAMRDAADD